VGKDYSEYTETHKLHDELRATQDRLKVLSNDVRIQLAGMAMAAIISKTDFKVFEHDETVDADAYTARGAVRYADALLKALSKSDH
jgi:hypothetical protein